MQILGYLTNALDLSGNDNVLVSQFELLDSVLFCFIWREWHASSYHSKASFWRCDNLHPSYVTFQTIERQWTQLVKQIQQWSETCVQARALPEWGLIYRLKFEIIAYLMMKRKLFYLPSQNHHCTTAENYNNKPNN